MLVKKKTLAMSGLNISDTHTKMGQRLGDTHDFPLTSTALIFYVGLQTDYSNCS